MGLPPDYLEILEREGMLSDNDKQDTGAFAAPQLSVMDRQSGVWREKIEPHLKRRLQSLRELNDRPHSELQTAAIRGAIDEIQRFLAMGADPNTESIDLQFEDEPELDAAGA